MYHIETGTPIAVSHIECIAFIRWHIVCYSNYSTMSHIEIGMILAICNMYTSIILVRIILRRIKLRRIIMRLYQKEKYMYVLHEMRVLANRFLQLSLLKQLSVVFLVYVTVLICSLFIQIATFLHFIGNF